MSWLLRLLAIGGLWRKLSGTYHQARSHVRQAGQFAHGVMEKHVQEALEKAEESLIEKLMFELNSLKEEKRKLLEPEGDPLLGDPDE